MLFRSLYEQPDVQEAFVQRFFDAAKDIKANMRKSIAVHARAAAKAAAPAKEKKTRAKKIVVEPDASPSTGSGRKIKTKITVNSQDALIQELVTLARSQNIIIEATSAFISGAAEIPNVQDTDDLHDGAIVAAPLTKQPRAKKDKKTDRKSTRLNSSH